MLPKQFIVHLSNLSKSNRKIPYTCNVKWWYHDVLETCECKHKCKYDTYTKEQWKNHSRKNIEFIDSINFK